MTEQEIPENNILETCQQEDCFVCGLKPSTVEFLMDGCDG